MDYKKHYDALIAKRRTERLAKVKSDFGKVETHHVLPKSLGGSDDDGNLVNLTSREHYLAHWLLYKMLPDCPQMAIAFKLMADIRDGERHISSKLYEKLKVIT